MEKLSTIQKRNNLNHVFVLNEPGPGNGRHLYVVQRADNPDRAEQGEPLAYLQFQKGPRNDPNATHGVLDQDLLEIVRNRLACFCSGDLSTPETAHALEHVEMALMYLNKRTEDRAERAVLGTMKE